MKALCDDIRVLCVRLDGMGDMVMTAPAIAALRATAPKAHIGLLTSEAGAAAARCMSFIDQHFVISVPWIKHDKPAQAETCLQTIAALEAAHFELAIIFSCYSQSVQAAALFCYLARIPQRTAYTKDKSYALLTDAVPDPDTNASCRHEVERHLALVGRLGAQYDGQQILNVGAHLAGARARLRAAGIGPQTRWILLHPGATAASRRYPLQQWSEVIRLLDKAGVRSVIAGGTADRAILGAIERETTGAVTILIDEGESIMELAALIACAPALLCNNSGPSHIASCLNTPVVCLYALINPQHTPWGRRRVTLSREMPCRNCASSVCPAGRNACIADVAPHVVAEATLALLEAEPDLVRRWPPMKMGAV